jgi:urea transporter
VYLWRKSLLYPILAAVISVPLVGLFSDALGVPPLNAPLVVTAWIVIVVGRLEKWFRTDWHAGPPSRRRPRLPKQLRTCNGFNDLVDGRAGSEPTFRTGPG